MFPFRIHECISITIKHILIVDYYRDHCSANRVLTLRVYRVYVFRYQNRVNSEVNSIFGKIGRFDEFDRVNTW